MIVVWYTVTITVPRADAAQPTFGLSCNSERGSPSG